MSLQTNPEPVDGRVELLAEAFVASSNRSRRVIIIMVIASIVFGIALWNSMSGSWIKSRIERAHIALEHQSWAELTFLRKFPVDNRCRQIALSDSIYYALQIRLDDSLKISNISPKVAYEFFVDLTLDSLGPADTITSDGQFILSKSEGKLRQLWHGLYLCNYRGLACKEDVKRHLEMLEQLRTNNVTVVPITAFGVVIDINDLAFIGGLTFALLLLWLRMSTARELVNLRIVLQVASQKEIPAYRYWYLYLAMRQVMSVPRLPNQLRRGLNLRIWRWVPRLLFLIPFVVQLAIVLYDLFTLRFGQSISEMRSSFNLWAGAVLSLIVLVLSVWSLCLARSSDRSWDSAADDLGMPKLRDWQDMKSWLSDFTRSRARRYFRS